MKPKKPSAEDRTVSLFAVPVPPAAEVALDAPDTEKAERVPLEQDVDRMRQHALLVQSWTSAAFADPHAEANGYRVSKSGHHYFLEVLQKEAFKPAYGYTGLFVHEKDLVALVTVLVQAAREQKSAGSKADDSGKK